GKAVLTGRPRRGPMRQVEELMNQTNRNSRAGRAIRGLVAATTIAGLAFGAAAGSATAQDYPDKPIMAIVPFAAGGGTDTQARLWGEAMAPLIGQQVVIQNVAGAAGVIGTKQGIASDPDGYNVVFGVASTITINPFTVEAADYSP